MTTMADLRVFGTIGPFTLTLSSVPQASGPGETAARSALSLRLVNGADIRPVAAFPAENVGQAAVVGEAVMSTFRAAGAAVLP
ncbi:hypothetical protein [Methylobacterium radiotolerans]|nr:hypothetical protein [Methylobacterium radiotolerans]